MTGRGAAIPWNHDDPAIGVLASALQGKRVTFGLGPGAAITARRVETAGPEGCVSTSSSTESAPRFSWPPPGGT